jgi:hypothetical protein
MKEFGFEKEIMIWKRWSVKICEKYHDKIRIINLQNAYHSLQEMFTEHTWSPVTYYANIWEIHNSLDLGQGTVYPA